MSCPSSLTGTDTGTDTGTEDDSITDCGVVLTDMNGDACEVVSGTSAASQILLRGNVLAGDEILKGGSVLVDKNGNPQNARIACASCDCAEQVTDAVVIDCADAVISPGLINMEEHFSYGASGPTSVGNERYDHRHEWRHGLNGHTELEYTSATKEEDRIATEMRMLMSGTTSVVGYTDQAGLVRNLDDATNNEGVSVERVNTSLFPLNDVSGTMVAAGCEDYSSIDDSSETTFLSYQPTISEGVAIEAHNEFLCLSGVGVGSENLIVSNTAMVGGISLTAPDVSTLASADASLIWTPRHQIQLYGNTAPVVALDLADVNIALGTMWQVTGSSNLLRELQCVDAFNANNLGNHFSDKEIWEMVTSNGAEAAGMHT